MGTKIEWATETWNPVTGCTKVSEGCQNCYAERMAKRLAGRYGYPKDDPFRVTLHPNRLEQPLKWRKPRRIFVCSMGDLFHDDVPVPFLVDVFDVVYKCPQHTFIFLTKRPENLKWLRINGPIVGAEPLSNVWLGVTAENQKTADERIPILLRISAAVKFVSVEPMLGPMVLCRWIARDGFRKGLNWVICGGESGPGARPMHPDWARGLRDQCQTAGVPFFFKQWGEYCYVEQMTRDTYVMVDKNVNLAGHGDYDKPWKVGKKDAGALLDGEEWNEYPWASWI